MIIDPGLDAQAFHDQLKDLSPSCVVMPCPDRWPPAPELLAEIRAAAEPQPPDRLERVRLAARANGKSEAIRALLDEAIRQHILRRAASTASAMREVYRHVDT